MASLSPMDKAEFGACRRSEESIVSSDKTKPTSETTSANKIPQAMRNLIRRPFRRKCGLPLRKWFVSFRRQIFVSVGQGPMHFQPDIYSPGPTA